MDTPEGTTMAANDKTSKQEKVENTRRQEAERLRRLATEMENELLVGNGATTPSADLMYRMVRSQGLEIDELKNVVANADLLRPAWLQWWHDRHVFVQRCLLFLPFITIWELFSVWKILGEFDACVASGAAYAECESLVDGTSIVTGFLPLVFNFLQRFAG